MILDGCLVGNPCENDGVCISTGPTSYDCECSAGYQGQNCTEGIILIIGKKERKKKEIKIRLEV